MGGAHSRRKGQVFERFLSNLLGGRRGFQSRAGDDECDVEGVSLPGLGPVWIEAKCGKSPQIHAAMRQAEAARDDRPPIVVSRKNSTGGGKPSVDLVTMRLADWLALVEER